MSAEIVIGAKIHIAADLFGELEFHSSDLEKTRGSVLVELDEKIDVAVVIEVVTKNRSECREAANRMTSGETTQDGLVDSDVVTESHAPMITHRAGRVDSDVLTAGRDRPRDALRPTPTHAARRPASAGALQRTPFRRLLSPLKTATSTMNGPGPGGVLAGVTSFRSVSSSSRRSRRNPSPA